LRLSKRKRGLAEGVEKGDTEAFEVLGVSGDDGELMVSGGGGDKGVGLGSGDPLGAHLAAQFARQFGDARSDGENLGLVL
jgi:hypothetical protein